MSRSTKGHHLNNLGRSPVPNAVRHVSWPTGSIDSGGEDFLKVFTIHGYSSHNGHVTWMN